MREQGSYPLFEHRPLLASDHILEAGQAVEDVDGVELGRRRGRADETAHFVNSFRRQVDIVPAEGALGDDARERRGTSIPGTCADVAATVQKSRRGVLVAIRIQVEQVGLLKLSPFRGATYLGCYVVHISALALADGTLDFCLELSPDRLP